MQYQSVFMQVEILYRFILFPVCLKSTCLQLWCLQSLPQANLCITAITLVNSFTVQPGLGSGWLSIVIRFAWNLLRLMQLNRKINSRQGVRLKFFIEWVKRMLGAGCIFFCLNCKWANMAFVFSLILQFQHLVQ